MGTSYGDFVKYPRTPAMLFRLRESSAVSTCATGSPSVSTPLIFFGKHEAGGRSSLPITLRGSNWVILSRL